MWPRPIGRESVTPKRTPKRQQHARARNAIAALHLLGAGSRPDTPLLRAWQLTGEEYFAFYSNWGFIVEGGTVDLPSRRLRCSQH
jgi:hypothetical protein